MSERFLRQGATPPVTVETDRDKSIRRDLIEPHYSDPRFDWKTHTVFLDPKFQTKETFGTEFVERASYEYSDRLVSHFGHDVYRDAYDRASDLVGDTDCARFYEELLRILYKEPNVQLVHIITGVNVSNGYPFKVFGTVNPFNPEA